MRRLAMPDADLVLADGADGSRAAAAFVSERKRASRRADGIEGGPRDG